MVLVLLLLMGILKSVLPVAVVVVLDGLQRAEVNKKSGSNLRSLFLLNSTLCKMSWWTLWAASMSKRCRLKPVLRSGNYLGFLFYIYLYCMEWILNSSFSSQCRACNKSIAIVQRLMHPPGCALLLKCCGILCVPTEIHSVLPGGAFYWKPVNLTFQAWNWNYRRNILWN